MQDTFHNYKTSDHFPHLPPFGSSTITILYFPVSVLLLFKLVVSACGTRKLRNGFTVMMKSNVDLKEKGREEREGEGERETKRKSEKKRNESSCPFIPKAFPRKRGDLQMFNPNQSFHSSVEDYHRISVSYS